MSKLDEIKARLAAEYWEDGMCGDRDDWMTAYTDAAEDVAWLVGEVERLRVVLSAARDIELYTDTFGNGSIQGEWELEKAIKEYDAAGE